MPTWVLAEPAWRLGEKVRSKADPKPQALACYGLLVRHVLTQPAQRQLRLVARRPVSAETTALLAWCSERLAAQGRTAVLLIWDNASWHLSKEVRTWLRHSLCVLGCVYVRGSGARAAEADASDRA